MKTVQVASYSEASRTRGSTVVAVGRPVGHQSAQMPPAALAASIVTVARKRGRLAVAERNWFLLLIERLTDRETDGSSGRWWLRSGGNKRWPQIRGQLPAGGRSECCCCG